LAHGVYAVDVTIMVSELFVYYYVYDYFRLFVLLSFDI